MSQTDAEKIRITLTLNKDVYNKVKRISKVYGLRPSTWMTMLVSSNVNNADGRTDMGGEPVE